MLTPKAPRRKPVSLNCLVSAFVGHSGASDQPSDNATGNARRRTTFADIAISLTCRRGSHLGRRRDRRELWRPLPRGCRQRSTHSRRPSARARTGPDRQRTPTAISWPTCRRRRSQFAGRHVPRTARFQRRRAARRIPLVSIQRGPPLTRLSALCTGSQWIEDGEVAPCARCPPTAMLSSDR